MFRNIKGTYYKMLFGCELLNDSRKKKTDRKYINSKSPINIKSSIPTNRLALICQTVCGF